MKKEKKDLAQLLQEAQEGNRDSLEILCGELEKIVGEYFRFRFEGAAPIEDLKQETILRFLKSFRTIQNPMRLKNFILKIAFAVFHDVLREKYRWLKFSEHQWIERENPRFYQDLIPGTISGEILSEMEIDRLMSELPDQLRTILKLRADGYKYSEIARITGMEEGKVKMKWKRGLKNLKKIFFFVTF